ncbi:MAG: class I SAM-dependent methyltransferase [Alphaproteobacteria bacterium]|jgi:SAM-dependent methyltransferase|nr:class I SAM-dependent methyltransferase [Alphaproteobacteria bacterium]
MIGTLKSLFSKLAYWVNDTFPNAKSLVPKPLHRFVLLRIVGMNDQYERMLRENPERLFLQNDALPWVSTSYKQVLFVGTAVYTYQYEKLFADDPDRYTTIDRNPSTKVWGGKHHIVAPIEQINQHRPPGFFDCIVLSGVLAYRIPEHGDYGLVEQDDLRALLKVLHGVLRPGGLLLVGWNLRDMAQSLSQLGLLDPYFAPTDKTPWGTRKEFPGDPHVFEFYERR